MTIIDILKAARETISVPERWTTVFRARTMGGQACESSNPIAACWCAEGAVVKAARSAGCDPFTLASLLETLDETSNAIGYPHIAAANDIGGRDVAIAVLDRAIAELDGDAR